MDLPMDDLAEYRADHVLGEYLEQQSFAGLGRAVDQDLALPHLGDVVAVAGQALVDHVEIGVRAVLEPDAVGAKLVDGGEDIVGGERDMLDALAFIFAQELLDLAMLVDRKSVV